MAYLTRQHGNLAAVVGVVRDQVTKKASHIRAKSLDAAIGVQRAANQLAESLTALLQARTACAGVTVARSSCGGISLPLAETFSHITRTLCM